MNQLHIRCDDAIMERIRSLYPRYKAAMQAAFPFRVSQSGFIRHALVRGLEAIEKELQ